MTGTEKKNQTRDTYKEEILEMAIKQFQLTEHLFRAGWPCDEYSSDPAPLGQMFGMDERQSRSKKLFKVFRKIAKKDWSFKERAMVLYDKYQQHAVKLSKG